MKRIILVALLALTSLTLWAVPARRDPFTRTQPNGDTITLRQIGDEHWHAVFTADGYLVAQNAQGYYCYARWKKTPEPADIRKGKVAVPTRKKAKDAAKRSKCEQRWLVRHQIDTL